MKNGIELKYWRTKSKAEVDFVVEEKNRVVPVEVKSNLEKPKITKSFHSFLEKYKPKKSLVLSEKLFSEKGKISFRPLFYIRREIK